ncbi:MAG: biotin-dependent carboxyltransferase family protein, partial [Pseudomonadota bacterium]
MPESGPMDRFGFAAAHALLGRETTGTAIEVSLGGLALDWVEGTCTVAVAGGGFRCTLDGVRHEGWRVLTLTPGSRLTITGGAWGSWCYLAFAGTLDVPRWLGAAATHGQSGLGGGMITPGQMIRVTGAEAQPARNGAYDIPPIAKPRDTLRVVPGPQDHLFDADSLTQLSNAAYKVTDAYDRMGIRLDGPTLALADALSIPSEPILRGSIQVTGTGVPTILMADHQTTGGYPKIATVISADLAPLSQHRAGDDLRFKAVTPEAAN